MADLEFIPRNAEHKAGMHPGWDGSLAQGILKGSFTFGMWFSQYSSNSYLTNINTNISKLTSLACYLG